MKKTEFRSDYVYGEGIREPAAVIAYEFFELQNTDIPRYILEHYQVSPKCQETWQALINEMEELGACEDIGTAEQEKYAAELIDGLNINYVLWLASKDNVIDLYGADEDDIDEYEVSDVILSDLGPDGRLYGYVNDPQPINR